jgi:hypothetical protein
VEQRHHNPFPEGFLIVVHSDLPLVIYPKAYANSANPATSQLTWSTGIHSLT